MNHSLGTTSVAGTWGESRRRKPQSGDDFRRSTTFRDSFHDGYMKDHVEKNNANAYSKFRTTQDSSFMLLPYGVENPHINALPCEDARVDLSMYETASGLSKGRDHTSPMKRTMQQLSTSSLAPVAMGRSGFREERGVSTSGLGGEKLCLSSCPSINSLVQRTWLPHEDPALTYKINGVPRAAPVSGLSLPVGEGKGRVEPGWTHQRKSSLVVKMYARGLGKFYDEYEPRAATAPTGGRSGLERGTGAGSPMK